MIAFPATKKKSKPFFGSIETECYYCEETLIDSNRSRDHVIPRELGGKLTKYNKVWACVCCNGIKNNKTLNVWKHSLMKMKCPKKGVSKIHVYQKRLTIIKNIDKLLKLL